MNTTIVNAFVILALAAMATALWLYDEMKKKPTPTPTPVQKELAYMQCAEDRRAVHNIRFDYNMRETCVNIMNGEAVL